jgi:pimeloyl-ACP methyl ester carboxylesterase
LGDARPSDYAFDYLDVSFDTDDSVTLSGWYIPSTNGAAVVLAHGASSTRTSVLDQAAVVAKHGYGVLAFDARGHGRSGGRAMEFGWYGERDIAAAVTYLRTRPEVEQHRIGVLGMSMGGESAIGALAADPRIAAVVAEGATNRVYRDKEWMADRYGLRGRFQLGIEWMTYQLTKALTEAKPPLALADSLRAAAPRPALLIAAGNVEDERIVGERLRAGAPGNVELWIADGADHTGGLRAQPEEWTRRVTEFFDSALQPPAQ